MLLVPKGYSRNVTLSGTAVFHHHSSCKSNFQISSSACVGGGPSRSIRHCFWFPIQPRQFLWLLLQPSEAICVLIYSNQSCWMIAAWKPTECVFPVKAMVFKWFFFQSTERSQLLWTLWSMLCRHVARGISFSGKAFCLRSKAGEKWFVEI